MPKQLAETILNLKTMRGATNPGGTVVKLMFGVDEAHHSYVMPLATLGSFIDELIQLHHRASVNRALAESQPASSGEPDPAPAPTADETLFVSDVQVVPASDPEHGSTVTLRITTQRPAATDIVFERKHLEFALAARGVRSSLKFSNETSFHVSHGETHHDQTR